MSPVYQTPAVLLPFQQRWLQDPARVKVFEKSRRIGASWATAAHSVLEAGSGAQDVWYVSYNEESGKEFIRDCLKWCKWLNIAAHDMGQVLIDEDEEGNFKGVRAFQIAFPSGMRITALTSSPRNLRGRQGLVIIDEAAFHDNLSEVLKAAFALLMWGGQVWIMSTHNGIDSPFADLCDEVRDGKRPYSLHRVTIEDALAEGLYERICMVLGQPHTLEAERAWLADLEREYGDGVREELYCEPARGGQAYLGRPLIEACMRPWPVLRLERADAWIEVPQDERTRELTEWCEVHLGPLLDGLPAHLPHCFGWDFGRYADRSVLAPCTLGQDLVRRIPFLVEMLGLPHADQWTVMQYVGARLPYFMGAQLDAGGNGSWIAEQAFITWGDIAVQVQLSLPWYAENMPPFREAHERGVIEYPRDLDVRSDLQMIRRIDGVPRLPKDKNASEGGRTRRHGDAAIALCLAYAASRGAEAESARWKALSAPFDPGAQRLAHSA